MKQRYVCRISGEKLTLSLYSLRRAMRDKLLLKLGFQSLFRDNVSSFYFHALNRQTNLAERRCGPPSVNYYEFGVGLGGTLINYIKALRKFCKRSKKELYSYHIFAFDSFNGLPKKKSPKDDYKEWYEGCYSHSLSEIKQRVIKQGIDLRQGTVHLIKGFYEKTLTPELRNELKDYPPSIVTIDCDYYSSTKTVLEWLRPMLVSGTLFYFDDIWSFHGNPHYGELAAINEFNKAEEGQLTPIPLFGLSSKIFIYSRREFEFTRENQDDRELNVEIVDSSTTSLQRKSIYA